MKLSWHLRNLRWATYNHLTASVSKHIQTKEDAPFSHLSAPFVSHAQAGSELNRVLYARQLLAVQLRSRWITEASTFKAEDTFMSLQGSASKEKHDNATICTMPTQLNAIMFPQSVEARFGSRTGTAATPMAEATFQRTGTESADSLSQTA